MLTGSPLFYGINGSSRDAPFFLPSPPPPSDPPPFLAFPLSPPASLLVPVSWLSPSFGAVHAAVSHTGHNRSELTEPSSTPSSRPGPIHIAFSHNAPRSQSIPRSSSPFTPSPLEVQNGRGSTSKPLVLRLSPAPRRQSRQV